MNAAQVNLSFPPALATVTLYVAVPFSILMALLLPVVSWFRLTSAETMNAETMLVVIASAFGTGLFIYIAVGVLHARHALYTHYILTTEGITIQRKGHDSVSIEWNDFESGTFRSLAKTMTLRSSRLQTPVVLMNNGQYETPSWLAARDMALSKLAGRIQIRWL